ncbi:MAG: rRNA maturation RNase YbeY [Pseudomonadota bacterium]
MEIECSVEAGEWPERAALEGLSEAALRAAASAVSHELPEGAEVSILFADDDFVQGLNSRYRGKDKPTNVLSFAANEGGGPATPLLGDIVLAQQTIAREAIDQNKTFDHHLTHLLVHGFLHLLGYDHETDADGTAMENKERQILATLSIADPYGDSP